MAPDPPGDEGGEMKPVNGFKVWRINDSDWVWGTTFAQAVDGYMGQCGLSLDELFDYDSGGEIDSKDCEMSDLMMDKLLYTDEDQPKEKRTFREQLKLQAEKGEDVGMFASSEY